MVTILYGGSNPFSGLAPTPIVARSVTPVNPNERKFLLDSFTLNGQITGHCSGDFNYFYNRFNSLLNNFGQNFQSLQIKDGDSVVYDAPYSFVKNISVDSTKWVGAVPFSIEIDLYNSGYFSGQYGISDCVDQFAFEENDDCTVRLTHTVNAQGFNTDVSAIVNARNFVSNRTGWSSQVLPHFINDPEQLVLTEFNESVNRFDGSFEITETYLYDPNNVANTNSGVLKYNRTYDQNDVETSVQIQGTIQGGRTIPISELRNSLNNINFYNLASGYAAQFGTGILSAKPNPASFNENVNENVIDFSFTFTNNNDNLDPYIEDDIRVTCDFLENKTCVEYQGTILSDAVCNTGKWQEILDFYNNLDLKAKFEAIWANYGSGTINWQPTSQSYGEDQINNELTFAFEYCNDNGESFDECIDNFTYELAFAPGINQYNANTVLDGRGKYCIQNLGYKNRSNYSINGSARITDCCTKARGINLLKSQINRLSAQYFPGDRKVLLNTDFTFDKDNIVNFQASWSSEATGVIPGRLT